MENKLEEITKVFRFFFCVSYDEFVHLMKDNGNDPNWLSTKWTDMKTDSARFFLNLDSKLQAKFVTAALSK